MAPGSCRIGQGGAGRLGSSTLEACPPERCSAWSLHSTPGIPPLLFSHAASRDDKLRCMFSIYDVDGGCWGAGLGQLDSTDSPWGRRRLVAPAAHSERGACRGRLTASQPPTPGLSLPHPVTCLPCAGDGAISEEDMEIVLRQLAGSSLSDAELGSIIQKVGADWSVVPC